MSTNLSARAKRSPEEIQAIILSELARVSDSAVSGALHSFLIEPRMELRTWDWSADALEFPTWVIAESQRYDYGIVYSENGFGPDRPWGLVFSSERNFGADYCWYSSLQAAFADSRLIEEYHEFQAAGPS